MLSVMMTGHRPKDFTDSEESFAKDAMERFLLGLKKRTSSIEVISGMALGADTWWAQIGASMDLKLAAYIPFLQQIDGWSEHDIKLWTALRGLAAREKIFSEVKSPKFYHARNAGMVKDAHLCVATWHPSKTKGGTATTVEKIRKSGKPLFIIDLDELRVYRDGV